MNRIVVIEDDPAILSGLEATLRQYEQEEIRLRAGDRLLMYTDGITESRNPAGEEFGEDRLIDLVLRFKTNDATALAEAAIDAAHRFSNGNFEDDLTVVSICVD